MANLNECAGCPNKLDDSPFLQCMLCGDKYHLLCTSFSIADYNDMSVQFKNAWTCDMCRSKEPKKGNSNTPIRSTLYESSNVTLRSKPQSMSAGGTSLTASDVRVIIREELSEIFAAKFQELQNMVSCFESSLSAYNQELETVKSDQAAQSAVLHAVQKENDALRAANISMTQRLAQLEQQTRATNIEIQCIPEDKRENLLDTVQQLAKVIKCPLSESNIHLCTRLSKMDKKSPRPRSVLVKFNSPRLRDEFLAATSKFNKNNANDKLNTSHLGIGGTKKLPIYVTEHLTPETKQLHAAARRKVKELKYKFIWVRDGKIFVRKNEESNYVFIRNYDTVNQLS